LNGIVGFYISGNNVRFEINRKNADARGLRISSQLLDLARIVGEGT
ncbi:MAG: YfiR family protein, partial [Candidatus Eisenbacteria bacterium]|nr:YfiR family protein [Candidatus Eisenbacteria bacterium]